MPVCAIVQFPSPHLRVPALPVTSFGAALAELATDLLDTMRAAPGIGIAAPHIGVVRRVVVIELPQAGGADTYINPVLVWHSPEMVRHVEGSVSMPGVTEAIERSRKVRVEYQDVGGGYHIVETDGLLAICLQHEIDQLNGIFWIRRLLRLKRERILKRFGKNQVG